MKLSYNTDASGGININHKPVPKPRMTKRDKWKKRPIVMKYRAYCDILNLIDNQVSGRISKILDSGRVDLTFYLPIPKSRNEKEGNPHQVTPDIDNFIKAFFDALCDNDSHIWDVRARKVYTESMPGIYVKGVEG